jgi:hypothetical protein
MEENILKASDNPTLATELVNQALSDVAQDEAPDIELKLPSETTVDLPGGYITLEGEVLRTAEVRELNGKDEELISRSNTVGKMLNTIVSRGTVSIEGHPVNEAMLDRMFAGDRDALLLGIYKATFGNPAELQAWCGGCDAFKTIALDLDKDISRRVLASPLEDREFTVEGRDKEYTVVLPTGSTQKEMNSSNDKTLAELTTILLQSCVIAIDGTPIYNKNMVGNIGLQDRRKIAEAIAERVPGPKFEAITVTCPDCDNEVVVPINLGDLFRF